MRCCREGVVLGRVVFLAGSLTLISCGLAGAVLVLEAGSLVSRVLLTSPELAERSGSEVRAVVLSTLGLVLLTAPLFALTGALLPMERTLVLGASALPLVLGP